MLEVTLKKFTLVQGGKEKPIGTSIFAGAAVAILESLLQHGSKGCSYGSGPNTFGGCTRLRNRSGISDTLPPRCSKCCCCSIFFFKSKMEEAHWSAAGLLFFSPLLGTQFGRSSSFTLSLGGMGRNAAWKQHGRGNSAFPVQWSHGTQNIRVVPKDWRAREQLWNTTIEGKRGASDLASLF